MRATRAYIAGLGTTGLLLASAGSLLLVVSALFAFNAWPGSDVTDAVDSVVVDDDRPFRVSGPEQVALDAAPAAVAVAADGPGDSGPGAGTTEGGTGGSGPNDGSDGGFQNTDGGTGGGGTPPTGTPDDGSGGGGGNTVDTTNATDNLANSTEEATSNLGDNLADANPELGDAVSDTGEALSDIVRDLPDVKIGNDGVKLGDRTLLGQ